MATPVTGSPPDLRVKVGPMELKNPVLTASGTFGYGTEIPSLVDVNRLGGIVLKGLSLEPKAGNLPPRIAETPCGMLNAIGLANIGVRKFLEEKLPLLRDLDTAVIVNIYGHRVSEYGQVAKALRGAEGVSALEVNISCPNVDSGGMVFGSDPDAAARVTEKVLQWSDKPVIVKLSPNVTDIASVARAVEKAGAHGLSMINTLRGMSIDVRSREPKLGNVFGGLSGPAVRPVAVYMVYQVVRAVRIPVIGIGGIMDHRDALEFLIAGAQAVQVGTANFVRPQAALEIVEGLRNFCLEEGLESIQRVIGSLRPPSGTAV